jgi:hypothetical protein
MVTFHYFPTVLVSPTGLTEIPTQQVLYWHMYSAIHLAVKKKMRNDITRYEKQYFPA